MEAPVNDGPVFPGWEHVTAFDILEMQNLMIEAYAQPYYQNRFQKMEEGSFPDKIIYALEIEGLLIEVEGAIYDAEGHHRQHRVQHGAEAQRRVAGLPPEVLEGRA